MFLPRDSYDPTAGSTNNTRQADLEQGPEIDEFYVVFLANLFILGFLGLIVLWRLPRAVARYARWEAWKSGYMLSHVQTLVPLSNSRSPPTIPFSNKEGTDASSLEFRVLVQPNATNYPIHIPSYWGFLRPLASTFQFRIAPGKTVGQALMLFLYFCAVIYLPFYASDPFTGYKREGFVAMAELPFVYLFASKNNILSTLMGIGYEKLNFVHRFIGRFIILCVNIHSIGYIANWANSGVFYERVVGPENLWGFIAFVSINVLFFGSLLRKQAYTIFLWSHTVGWLVMIPGCWFHKPIMRPYLYAVIAIVMYDRIMRMVKSRFSDAVIRPMPDIGCTRVQIPSVNAGWRPGQHVRLRVFSSAMGFFGWTEVHPFTIASVSGSPEGMVLLCKKTGGWTNKLFEAAKAGGYSLSSGVDQKVSVHVEGPYGGVGHTVIPSYSGVMLVAGGCGITFALAALQDILQKDLTGESRVRIVELIWVVQNPTSMGPLLSTFATMLKQAVFTSVKISVFYTRAQPLGTKLTFNPSYFPENMSLNPGRPKLGNCLDGVISRISSTKNLGGKEHLEMTGILVGYCGPVGFGDECAKIVGMVDGMRRDFVGGIELHEETFEM